MAKSRTMLRSLRTGTLSASDSALVRSIGPLVRASICSFRAMSSARSATIRSMVSRPESKNSSSIFSISCSVQTTRLISRPKNVRNSSATVMFSGAEVASVSVLPLSCNGMTRYICAMASVTSSSISCWTCISPRSTICMSNCSARAWTN